MQDPAGAFPRISQKLSWKVPLRIERRSAIRQNRLTIFSGARCKRVNPFENVDENRHRAP